MLDAQAQERRFYGYVLSVVGSRSDAAYHDRASVQIEIRADGSDDVIHVVTTSTRSSHQLSKRYKAAADPTPLAIAEAESWILANRPDAVERRQTEAAHARDQQAERDRERLAVVGGDVVAYILGRHLELSTTDVGNALGLGSARKLNPLLNDWGIQRGDSRRGYTPVDDAHGEHVGFYAQLKWSAAGLKAIWDAAVAHGAAAGGDEEFVRRLRANTDWVPADPMR